jgi:hypothetical protein
LLLLQRWGETMSLWNCGLWRALCPSPRWYMSVYGAAVEWYWQGKTEGLGEKPVPVPLCSPQNPHELPWAQTRASAVRNRRLTAWAMARPAQSVILKGNWVVWQHNKDDLAKVQSSSWRKLVEYPLLYLWEQSANWQLMNYRSSSTVASRAIAQAVSPWFLAAQAQVRAEICPCGNFSGHSGTGTGFSPTPSVFPVSIIPPLLYIHSCIIWGMGKGPVRGRSSLET